MPILCSIPPRVYDLSLKVHMTENAPSFQPYLCQRFQALIWSCLDSDLTKTAVFYAERYFAMEPQSHEARHLYATALLQQGQPHSALTLVKVPREQQCIGCLELKAKCCTALGRHRQAKEALEESLRDVNVASSGASLMSAFARRTTHVMWYL